MAETAEIRQKLGRDIFDYQQLTACLSHLSKPRDEIAATGLRLVGFFAITEIDGLPAASLALA